MRHNLRILLRLTLFLLVCSCQQSRKKEPIIAAVEKEKTSKELFQIDPRKFVNKDLKITDFASDVKYLPLSNKFRLSLITNIKVTSEAIYLVSDKNRGGEGNGFQELFRFDSNGQNPVKIGNVGKGPKEYLTSELFAVDEANNRVYISGKLNTVLVFDTQGNYIRQFKFQNPNKRFARLECFGQNQIFIPEQQMGAKGPNLWSVMDTLGNIITSKRNTTTPFETRIGSRSGTFKFQDKISYWVEYNDTVFTLFPDLSYQPSYIIPTGEHRKPKKDFPITIDLPQKLLQYYSPISFIETKQYLISQYNFKGQFAYVFIDKNRHNTFVCEIGEKWNSTFGIPNNFDGGMMSKPKAVFVKGDDEFLVELVQAYELQAHVQSDEFKSSAPRYPEKKEELKKLANSLSENDNPVLILVKLKD